MTRLSLGLVAGFMGCTPVIVQAQPDLPPPPRPVQITHEYDFEFATIDHPGNAPWVGDSRSLLYGYGSVPYTYRMSRVEVTSAQWLQYVNTFSVQPGNSVLAQLARIPGMSAPNWPGVPDPSYSGPGVRFRLLSPEEGLSSVTNLSWRAAAVYVNWLCNGRSSDAATLLSGAYGVSTFGVDAHGQFTDQLTHTPGAPFWIPTEDEWLKAAHWDPDKLGPDQPGWWQYPTSSDVAPITGPPSEGGQTSTGSLDIFFPLLSYPDVQSPWGLFDASGGAAEWTESLYADPAWRIFDGSSIGGSPETDDIFFSGAERPWLYPGFEIGLRIAAAVPAPSSLFPVALIPLTLRLCRRSR